METEEYKKAEKILNETLWGVHKNIITSHWSLKKTIIEAMINYKNK